MVGRLTFKSHRPHQSKDRRTVQRDSNQFVQLRAAVVTDDGNGRIVLLPEGHRQRRGCSVIGATESGNEPTQFSDDALDVSGSGRSLVETNLYLNDCMFASTRAQDLDRCRGRRLPSAVLPPEASEETRKRRQGRR